MAANYQVTKQQVHYITPPEIATRLRITAAKVLGWIRSGKLRAIDVSNRYRPRYRINPEDLEEFLKSREVQPPPPRVQHRRQMPDGGPLDPEIGKKLVKEGKAVLEGKTYYRKWNGITLYF